MDEDTKIMIETQTDLINLLAKYPNHGLQSLAMVLKTVVDCYVIKLGEEGATKMLETAIDSINDGKHSHFLGEMPKNTIN